MGSEDIGHLVSRLEIIKLELGMDQDQGDWKRLVVEYRSYYAELCGRLDYLDPLKEQYQTWLQDHLDGYAPSWDKINCNIKKRE